jgi:hypothetical protein
MSTFPFTTGAFARFVERFPVFVVLDPPDIAAKINVPETVIAAVFHRMLRMHLLTFGHNLCVKCVFSLLRIK